ncbi:unnamed protein product [Prunus brigantina]
MCLRGNTRYATDGLPFGVRMKKLCPIMTPPSILMTLEVVMRAGIRLLKDNLCLRGKGFPEDSTNTRGRRYSDAGTHGLRPHAMHRWLCGTFGIYMSPRLGRHASRTACVYSLRMWAIVDAKGMADRSVVDVSYATLDVWASRVRCRMRSDCVVTSGRRLTGIRSGILGRTVGLRAAKLVFRFRRAGRRSLAPKVAGRYL